MIVCSADDQRKFTLFGERESAGIFRANANDLFMYLGEFSANYNWSFDQHSAYSCECFADPVGRFEKHNRASFVSKESQPGVSVFRPRGGESCKHEVVSRQT